MIDVIITKIKAMGSVQGLMDVDNVYPLFRLQDTPEPAVVVQLVDTDPQQTHDAYSDTHLHTIEITTFNTSPSLAWRVAGTIRQGLDGWAGDTQVQDVRFQTQATDVFARTDSFSVTQRYTCMEKV